MYPSFVSFDVSNCFNRQMYLSYEPTLGIDHLTWRGRGGVGYGFFLNVAVKNIPILVEEKK
jgi:hypothetical protein